jgi:two-component system response regulator (stage 0 sporulation protein F)
VGERILIVDDNERLCAILREELLEDGYEVSLAHDGRAGIQALKEDAYDLVVLDIRMPVMDGLDALGRILARDRHTPVVLHTAYGSYKDDFRAWSADAYVTKSTDTGLLKTTIRRLLDERAAPEEDS